jgi:hypothetical protein
MYIFQRNFLYHPYKNNYLRGEKLNVDFKEISVPSTEGITLKAWFYKNPQNKYTVLFFHGNAGELDAGPDRQATADHCPAQHGGGHYRSPAGAH